MSAAPHDRLLTLASGVSIRSAPAARDIRDATLVKEGDLFLLADLEGNVPNGDTNGFGLYYRDTRFVSTYELQIEGLKPTILLSSGRWHFLAAYLLTNPNLVTDDGTPVQEQTMQIRRYRVARARRLSESLTFQNFNPFAVAMHVTVLLDADFADMFDVRGLTTRDGPPRAVKTELEGDAMTFAYEACDGVRRTTRVRFDPAPEQLEAGAARYRLELPARGAARVNVEIDLGEELGRGAVVSKIAASTPPKRKLGESSVSVETSNGLFNAMLEQAHADLQTLISGDEDAPFIAAGIPWYAALFGRDAIITSMQELWRAPALARHTLTLLARYQGTQDDAYRDEEPGKILHEWRRGELAGLGLVPFAPYFGTVDATPLWIMLLAEYHRATADLELVRSLVPNLDAALVWIDEHGDRDRDGFVEYACRSRSGLVNQGWKDSWDGIVHAHGALAEAPLALVEVQAYVYAAKRGAAVLYAALGDEARARALEAEAAALRERFERAFWMESEGFYCLALDGQKRQVAAIASNAGHALWCGIASPERAALVARRLLSEDLFSGWGVRTLSNREVRYNPAGYHLGTVWPHDNAILAHGLARYGFDAQAGEIACGLYDAAQHFPSFRMPELFCGFARSAFSVPVRYPVACTPQAWAAGAWGMLLSAMLGTSPDANRRELTIVHPSLPSWLQWLQIERLAVGPGEVDLRYERVGGRTVVDVVAMRGDVHVTFSERCPS
jgi:glycogen debranching enzyme